jgi:hypothetical protein
MLEGVEAELLAFYAFPPSHWRKRTPVVKMTQPGPRVLATRDELEPEVAVEKLGQRQSGEPIETHCAKSPLRGVSTPLGTITTGQTAVCMSSPETSPSNTAGAGP